MSCPVNLQQLPAEVLQAISSPDSPAGRSPRSHVTPLSFPKTRMALWDDDPSGKKLCLQLVSRRRPQVLLQVKTLQLAQRHAHRSAKLRPLAFFLGSLSVDADEEGVTLTLDRFDPGRENIGSHGQDQPGYWTRVPSAVLPGDVVVPCLFSRESDENMVQSEAEFHHCFTCLQQVLGGRQTLDMSQVLKVRGHVTCSLQPDFTSFTLNWSVVGPVLPLEVQRLRPLPLIPSALLRRLTGVERSLLQSPLPRRGFLTMDQSRKLLLLLESDPKACSLPLVGVWLSGVTHVYNPLVWFWSVRYLLSPTLLDRVFSGRSYFLLVLFCSTHSAPQFFQCRSPTPGAGSVPILDYQLLTASQCVTLYQVTPVDGHSVCCRLEKAGGQLEVFRRARLSFSSAAPHAGHVSVDQDSGVEEEELSPRPSPSPHQHHLQLHRVLPSVPELSLLLDNSSLSGRAGSTSQQHLSRPPTAAKPLRQQQLALPPDLPRPPTAETALQQQPTTPICRPRPPNGAEPTCQQQQAAPSAWPRPTPPSTAEWNLTCQSPPHHSTPNCGSAPSFYCPTPSLLQAPAPNQTPPPSAPSAPPSLTSGGLPFPAQSVCPHLPNGQGGGAMTADTHHLLVQQEQQLRLLRAQVQMLLEAQQPRTSVSVAVGTGASLLMEPHPHCEDAPPTSVLTPPSHRAADVTGQEVEGSTFGGSSHPIPAEGDGHDLQGFYKDLMEQLTSRLQEEEDEKEVAGEGRGLCGPAPSCQHSRGPLDNTNQKQQMEDSSRPSQPVSAPNSASSCNLLSSSSVVLSLEASAISLRYSKNRQLEGHAHSPLSASNMSVATRKYLRKNGLMEVMEEADEGEEEKSWVEPQKLKVRPQGQLIQQQMGARRPETSVGNILDLSRLRQLPKLF